MSTFGESINAPVRVPPIVPYYATPPPQNWIEVNLDANYSLGDINQKLINSYSFQWVHHMLFYKHGDSIRSVPEKYHFDVTARVEKLAQDIYTRIPTVIKQTRSGDGDTAQILGKDVISLIKEVDDRINNCIEKKNQPFRTDLFNKFDPIGSHSSAGRLTLKYAQRKFGPTDSLKLNSRGIYFIENTDSHSIIKMLLEAVECAEEQKTFLDSLGSEMFEKYLEDRANESAQKLINEEALEKQKKVKPQNNKQPC